MYYIQPAPIGKSLLSSCGWGIKTRSETVFQTSSREYRSPRASESFRVNRAALPDPNNICGLSGERTLLRHEAALP